MNWIMWTVLYFIAGIICFICIAVAFELDKREKGEHLSFDSYFSMSFLTLIWPIIVVIVGITLIYLGIMFGCQKIADKIEKSSKNAVTICKDDDNNEVK